MGQGILILEEIPNEEVRHRVKEFLKKHAVNLSSEQLENLIKTPPLILSRRMPQELGQRWVYFLEVLGARARFVPLEKEASPNAPTSKVSKPSTKELQGVTAAPLSPAERPLKAGTLPPEVDKQPLEGLSPQTKEALDESEDSLDPYHDYGLAPTQSPLERKDLPVWQRWRHKAVRALLEVNKELWIVLTLVSLAALLNYFLTTNEMLLGLYTIPTVLSAYFFGRRHAVLTAFLSIIMVGILLNFRIPLYRYNLWNLPAPWLHFLAWGGSLLLVAYFMGTLYERHLEKIKELKRTYQGIIIILRHFISQDKYTENHCYRVSIYAAKIATYMGLSEQMIEDVRVAGLLHDIGKLKVSREILYKATKLSEEEFEEVKKHVEYAGEILEPLKGPLGRIIPIILAHHDRFDGSGYRPNKRHEIVLGARILAVADVYDALTSDRPYRKAMSPFEAKEIIVKGSGKDFDPEVVQAFVRAFEAGDMDVPNIVV